MGSAEILITGLMALAFAAIHLSISRIPVTKSTPRSRWLSFSGGVAVSYVFLHIMPQLGLHAQQLASEMDTTPDVAESIVYALALAGLAGFYGLERQVKLSRARSSAEGEGEHLKGTVLWLHVASYSVFNLLIGYLLLHREEEGPWPLTLFFGAMALHFITADYAMRKDHGKAYDRWGRWVLAGSALAGWTAGLAITLPAPIIAGLFAFIAGGIVLGVLKEELPEESQSYFLPFLAGTLVFAGLELFARLGL